MLLQLLPVPKIAVAAGLPWMLPRFACASTQNSDAETAAAEITVMDSDRPAAGATLFRAFLPPAFLPLPFVVSAAATNVPAAAFQTDLYALFIVLNSLENGLTQIAVRFEIRTIPARQSHFGALQIYPVPVQDKIGKTANTKWKYPSEASEFADHICRALPSQYQSMSFLKQDFLPAELHPLIQPRQIKMPFRIN